MAGWGGKVRGGGRGNGLGGRDWESKGWGGGVGEGGVGRVRDRMGRKVIKGQMGWEGMGWEDG